MQEKILRVIEYGEFERLGGSETINVDVRIIAATNEDLPALASEHRFREDLLDRLAFDVITLPPLRYRSEDIPVLAEHFAVGMVKEIGGQLFAGFSPSVTKALLDYDWPGNIRELKNVIERGVYQHGDRVVSHLVFNPFESPYRPRPGQRTSGTAAAAQTTEMVAPRGEPYDFKEKVQAMEIALLKQALEDCQFNQKRAAEHLGMTYHQLRGYLRKYELIGGDD